MGSWYGGGNELGGIIGLPPQPGAAEIVGVHFFWSNDFLWFYLYYGLSVAIFSAFWIRYSRHEWALWSVLVSAFILFSTYFSVQTSVALNNWRRPFFDLIQDALDQKTDPVDPSEIYTLLLDFAQIAFLWLVLFVITRFVVNHYVFRWRTAMNNYYMDNWQKVRHVEGASQRVQEDTMRFAKIVEDLGVSIVDSVLTLIAFLPILLELSKHVADMPIVGTIAAPLLWAAVVWSFFGTVLLAVVGIKLPGLEFKNQLVEAAYRKELVFGENYEDRAEPVSVRELFLNVRRNYFRLYLHYMYFNVARAFYIQADNIFVYVILVPTIAAGKITFGIMQQIITAFNQVSSSFQYLVNSWSTIVELLSIYKRLRTFEAVLNDENLSEFEQENIARTRAMEEKIEKEALKRT